MCSAQPTTGNGWSRQEEFGAWFGYEAIHPDMNACKPAAGSTSEAAAPALLRVYRGTAAWAGRGWSPLPDWSRLASSSQCRNLALEARRCVPSHRG